MPHKRKYWRIVGYDGTKCIYEDEVLLGCISEREMEQLLRALVSRAGLTYKEIVSSYSRRNTKRYSSLLETRKNTGVKFQIMCGTNPHFIASVIER